MFLNTLTGEYPRYQGDLELLGWVAGTPLLKNWVEVMPSVMPEAADDEFVYEAAPALVDGIYVQQWTTRPLTAQEIERKDAPRTARAKLAALGLNDAEIDAVVRGLL